MERTRAAIVAAARQAFLENGYAQASMDRIAESAAVSVKTIYRHVENKDELFNAVMQAACRADNSILAERGDDASPAARFTWFEESPARGMAAAVRDYLRLTPQCPPRPTQAGLTLACPFLETQLHFEL
jgi:AcrR family transcriptional regulator